MTSQRSSSKDPMVHDWLRHIQQVNNEHEYIIKSGIKFSMPFVAISRSVVKTVFMIVDHFKLDSKTKYLALYLFDKFMCNKFWELYTKCGSDPDCAAWRRSSERLSSQARMRLMSCIQLASKMDSNATHLGISQVIDGLKLMEVMADEEREYNARMILNSEFKVFKTVEFIIPLVTPIDSIQVLLTAIGLNNIPVFYHAVVSILDFTYLQHEELYSNLQKTISTHAKVKTKLQRINFLLMESDILLLSASVIACALFFHNPYGSVVDNVVDELSKLVNIQSHDIIHMAHQIFSLVNPMKLINA